MNWADRIRSAFEHARNQGPTVLVRNKAGVEKLTAKDLEESHIDRADRPVNGTPPASLVSLEDVCAPLIEQLMRDGAVSVIKEENAPSPRHVSRHGMHDLGSISVGGTKDFKRRSHFLIRAALHEMSQKGKNKTGEKKQSLIQRAAKAANTRVF